MKILDNSIYFSNYGRHLVSRLQSRSIFNELKNDLDHSSILRLNFEGINLVTLSFMTELFANLKGSNIDKVTIENANSAILPKINFAMKRINSKTEGVC